MSPLEILLILLAGVGAGTINAIVGSGSLVTFPTLLFFGVPPVVANMTNTVGVIPGGLSGVHGYRRELAGKGRLLRLFVPASLLGGVTGAGLLLVLPTEVFAAIVPVLIGIGVVLVVAAPAVQRRARSRAGHASGPVRVSPLLVVLIFLTGVYGGYFGAAQGVILLGVMSMLLSEDLQTINGIKNVLGLVANLSGAAVFVLLRGAEIDWWIAVVLGVGSLIGGAIGAGVGRRLPPVVMRAGIVAIGIVAIVRLTVWP